MRCRHDVLTMDRAASIINRAASRRELLTGKNRGPIIITGKAIYRAPKVLSAASRRTFLQGMGAGAIVAVLSRTRKANAKHARGGGTAQIPGFYPEANTVEAKLPLAQVYPIDDSSTKAWAPHRFAYWDGSVGFWSGKTIVMAFGRFPFIFKLLTAPTALNARFGATIWNSAWNNSGTAAAVAGYGKIIGSPTGGFTDAEVTGQCMDQDGNWINVSWPMSTSVAIANGGVFCFIANSGAAIPGNDSNPGTLALPYASTTGAFGSNSSGGANPGAIPVLRGSSVPYSLNPYGDGYLTLNGSVGPVALTAYPGESVELDGTSGYINNNSNDTIFQDVTANGYITTDANYRLVYGNASRQCYDNFGWLNGGYGTGGTNVPGMIYYAGNGSGLYTDVAFTGCFDNEHQSAFAGNNYSGAVLYSVTNFGIQYCEAITAGDGDGSWYPKGAVNNGSVTGCLANFTGGGGGTHAFDVGQQGGGGTGSSGNVESRYNTLLNMAYLGLPNSTACTGPFWGYRNSIVAPGGARGLYTVDGSVVTWDANAAQTSTAQPDGGGTVGLPNLSGTSGILNSDGTLASGQSASLGLIGAQILE